MVPGKLTKVGVDRQCHLFQVLMSLAMSIFIGLMVLTVKFTQIDEHPEKGILTKAKQMQTLKVMKPVSPQTVAVVLLPPPPRSTPINKAQKATSESENVKPLNHLPIKPLDTIVKAHLPVLKIVEKKYPGRKLSTVKVPSVESAVFIQNENTMEQGRVLLRVLEHRNGPMIELAWPRQKSRRAQLYTRLKSCYGMGVALMDSSGRLFNTEGNPGEEWLPNMDNFSGLVRQASGIPTLEERQTALLIRKHHELGRGDMLVRLFPRWVDARLLGGLRQLAGKDRYTKAKHIRAQYIIAGKDIQIGFIQVDGRTIDGVLDFGRGRGC